MLMNLSAKSPNGDSEHITKMFTGKELHWNSLQCNPHSCNTIYALATMHDKTFFMVMLGTHSIRLSLGRTLISVKGSL